MSAPWPTDAEASELDVQRQAWPEDASSLYEAMVARIRPQIVRREREAAARGWNEGWNAGIDAAEECDVAGGMPCGECAVCNTPNPYQAEP